MIRVTSKPMPLLLSVAMWLFSIGAFFGVGWGVLILCRVIPNPVPGDPHVALNLQNAFLIVGGESAVLGLLSGLAAYGLRMERLWTRDAIILWCVASCLGTFCISASANGIGWKAALATVSPLIFAIAVTWYVFRWPTVVEYYAALEQAGG